MRWISINWVARTPRGWTLMAYERNGKMVCRYFYPEPQA